MVSGKPNSFLCPFNPTWSTFTHPSCRRMAGSNSCFSLCYPARTLVSMQISCGIAGRSLCPTWKYPTGKISTHFAWCRIVGDTFPFDFSCLPRSTIAEQVVMGLWGWSSIFMTLLSYTTHASFFSVLRGVVDGPFFIQVLSYTVSFLHLNIPQDLRKHINQPIIASQKITALNPNL